MLVIATQNELYPVNLEAMAAGLGRVASISIFDLPRPRHLHADQEDAVVAALANADGMLVRIGSVTARLLDRLPRLRVIALHGVGVDQVDVAAATERGIWVTNTPGANTQAVVELTIALMIDVLRRVSAADRSLRYTSDWDGSRYLGGEVASRTVGLVGFGHIGQRVAAVCQALGATVIATRQRGVTGGQACVRLVDLPTLLAEADIISLHLPLTDATRGLIDADAFARMKRGAYLINTSRGPIVDSAALEAALVSGHLAGAGLDVFGNEPPDFSSPIFGLPNTVVTPHMAGSTREALASIAYTAASDIARALRGETPLHAVNEPRHPQSSRTR